MFLACAWLGERVPLSRELLDSMDLTENARSVWAAYRALFLGIVAMLATLFGFLHDLYDHPQHVVAMTNLEPKSEVDVDEAMTSSGQNVGDTVRLEVQSAQVETCDHQE